MARHFTRASSQSVSVHSPAGIPNTFPFSMACWVRVDDFSALSWIFTATSGAGFASGYYALWAQTNSIFVAQIGASNSSSGQVNIGTGSANVWYHIGFAIRDATGGDWIVYFNGSPTTSVGAVAAPVGGMTDVAVGVLAANGSNYMSGRVAEAAIWNVVITGNEFKAMANGTPPGQIRPQNLKLYWPLYGAASTEADLSGQKNNGTVNNGATLADHAPVGRYAPFPNPYSRVATFVNASGLYVPQRTLRGAGI